MSVERNAPCPCGSGRKYKKCCLNAVEDARAAESRDLAPLRGAIAALDLEYEGFLTSDAGREARLAFHDHEQTLAQVAAREMSLLAFYVYFDHVPEPGSVPDWTDGETLADRFLRLQGACLTADQRAAIESVQSSVPSLYEVLAMGPGATMRVRDLFTARELDVVDPLLAGEEVLGDIECLRLGSFGGTFRILAQGVVPLPAFEAGYVRELRDDAIAQEDATWTDEQLRDLADEVRIQYLELAEQYSGGDDAGEEIGPTSVVELEFEVPSADDAFEALGYLGGEPEEAERDVLRDEDDNVISADWPWLDDPEGRGGPAIRVVGAFYAEGTRLIVEVPDEAGGMRARRLVSEAIPEAREVKPQGDDPPGAKRTGK